MKTHLESISLLFAIVCCCLGCATVESQPTGQASPPSWSKVSTAQIAEATKLGVPLAFENEAGIKFVLCPAGEFMMGSADDEEGRYDVEGPQHKVTTIIEGQEVMCHPLRGGGLRSTDRRVRTASRYSYPATIGCYYTGFRVVMER